MATTLKGQLLEAVKSLSMYNIATEVDRLSDNTDVIIEQNRVLISQNRDMLITFERLITTQNTEMENTMSTAKELVAQLGTELSDLKSVRLGFETVIATFTANAQNALDSGDMAALQNLVTEFDSTTKELANAIVANTPAAVEAPVTQPVEPVVVEPTAPVEPTPDAPPAEPTA